MKILLITKKYPPAICGVGDHSYQLKKHWEAMGHRVWVLTETGLKQEELINTGVHGFGPAIRSIIQETVRQHQVDLVFWQYVPYSYQKKGLPFWWPGLVKQVKRTGVSQCIYFHEVSLRYWKDGIRQTLLARAQRSIANKANRLAHQSFTSIPLYQSYFSEKLPVIQPVGSNIPAPGEGIGTTAHRIFSFASRIDQTLVSAFSLLQAQYPVDWVIGGTISPAQQSRLEGWLQKAGLAENTRITGTVPLQDLSDEIQAASIVVLPQPVNRHGQGGVSGKNGTAMAAMMLGKPLLSCKGDMTDPLFFEHGQNCWLVPFGDPVAYAGAIRELLANPALRQKLGSHAAQTYQTHSGWERISRELLRHIQDSEAQLTV